MPAIPLLDEAQVPFFTTFVLIFAIVYGLLSIARIGYSKKGERPGLPKGVNIAIALVFALFSAMYEPLAAGLQAYLPLAAIVLVMLFFVVFVKRLFSPEEGKAFDALPVAASLGIMLLVLGTFWGELGIAVPGFSNQGILWLIGILFIIIIFYAAYRHKEK